MSRPQPPAGGTPAAPARSTRAAILFAAALATVAVLLPSTPAFASTGGDNPSNNGGSHQVTDQHDQLTSKVSVARHGSGNEDGGKPLSSSDASWTPPVCWYEPFFTPDQLKTYLKDQYDYYGQRGAMTVYNFYNELQSQAAAVNYHKGDKGKWWWLVQNPYLLGYETCPYTTDFIWVGPANPAPPNAAITPEELSRVAYNATDLPAPAVKLSPSPDHQVVNLPTYITFSNKKPLTKVWTTASLASLGIAATVVAHPASLRVTTDDPDASPQSCTYALSEGAGGAYKVNSADAGCNITFLRASKGSYSITAHLTWRVSWTPTTNPDAGGQTAMPDAFSDSDPQAVTVREIQTVNR
jgi:enoyl reductase